MNNIPTEALPVATSDIPKSEDNGADDTPRSDHQLTRTLAAYRGADQWRSMLELSITIVPFVALWACAWASLSISYWLTPLFVIAAAGFLVRLFMIQHDCGHGAFFRQRVVNDWVGRVIGVLTLTPYDFWRRTHAVHHATSGDLDRRGIGDIDTLTVREYLALRRGGRLRYTLYRNPFVMFGLGAAYLFLFRHRFPSWPLRAEREAWTSTIATDLGIAFMASTMMWIVGVGPFLLVHLPIALLGASAGVWLFYVQHQFEDTFWVDHSGWSFRKASLRGSSHYDLPPVLRWFTANIGVHHVHHLSSTIPFYRLHRVLRDHPRLYAMGRLTLWRSFGCARLALWDESQGRLISFKDLYARDAASFVHHRSGAERS